MVAVDSSKILLEELAAHSDGIDLELGDLTEVVRQFDSNIDLCVCMGDTLTHLESTTQVDKLFGDVYRTLHPDGHFILSYRDLSKEIRGADKFIPIRQDQQKIFTCFLEYFHDTVTVHDLVHSQNADGWTLNTSAYSKLRLDCNWMETQLRTAGFNLDDIDNTNGVVRIIARKQ